MRLRQDGVLVYGFGRSKTPEAFKTACTRFIEVDSLTETDVVTTILSLADNRLSEKKLAQWVRDRMEPSK